MPNNHILSKSDFKGTTKTMGRMFSFGWFPYVTLKYDDGEVVGEVYSVDEHTLQRLDYLEGYRDDDSSFYHRSLISTEYGDAWIYHIEYRDDKGHSYVEGGDWCEFNRQPA